MSDERHGLDPDFAQRMRAGLSTMAVRERRRERARRRVLGIGAATAAVAGVVALGLVQLGVVAVPGDETAPPPTHDPGAVPTETAPAPPPEAEDPAPPDDGQTPPAGFEGVDPGEVVALGSGPHLGGTGDAAADDDWVAIDVYVLCSGAGQVLEGGAAQVDCAAEPAGTIVMFSGWDDPDAIDITTSGDFDGTVEWVPTGELPQVASQGGTATVEVACVGSRDRPQVYVVGGITFDCATVGDIPYDQYTTLAAWGVPYEAGQLGPAITSDDPLELVRIELEGGL